MRSFLDSRGRLWDAVVGRESWGRVVMIFVPADGAGEVLEAPLAASGYEEAERDLDAMDPLALDELLARAAPKEIG